MKSLSVKIEARVRELRKNFQDAQEAGADKKTLAEIHDELKVYDFAREIGYELERWSMVGLEGNASALTNYIQMKDDMKLLLLKHGWDG